MPAGVDAAGPKSGNTVVTGHSSVTLRDGAAVDVRDADTVDRSSVGLDFDWVQSPAKLQTLRSGWQVLEEHAARPHNFFQSFVWCNTWASVYLDGTGNAALKVLVARNNGAIVMIWPLMTVRYGPVTVLKWLSDPIGQYGDVLIAPDAEEDLWLEAAWRRITGDPGLDGIALRHVRADARIHRFVELKCRALPETSAAPQLDLRPFSTAQDYSQALSRNQRSQRSKLLKKIERDGPVRFDVHTDEVAFREAVRTALSLKKHWLEEHSLKADTIGDPRFERLLTRLAEQDPPAAAAGVLSRGHEPLSVDIAFTYRGRYFGSVISMAPDHQALSPAKVHLDLRQKACVEAGFSEFDMMIPASAFKRHWSDSTVEASDYIVAMNLWGFAYCSFYLGVVRPFLKRAYYACGDRPRAVLLGTLRALGLAK